MTKKSLKKSKIPNFANATAVQNIGTLTTAHFFIYKKVV